MIVVDASVLVVALADDGPDGDAARGRLHAERLNAPELIDLEILSVIRGLERSGQILPRRATLAIRDLAQVPLRRARHTNLTPRCWELRANLTPYDASYVALAEALGVPLVTADTRLARAPGVTCTVEVLSTTS